MPHRPRVVLLCHDVDVIDREGLRAWLAASFDLAGVVVIRDTPKRRYRAARREWARSGALGFLDAMAFRVFYALVLRKRDRRWIEDEAERLRRRYGVGASGPTLGVDDPNGEAVRRFLERLTPDLVIARCKVLLRPRIFRLARAGTWVLHPGICPEYRNAHGCFWALVRRDLSRVGMTLLRIDEGVDTGPVFLQATCAVDERRESHVVIQYRVVTENLDAVADALRAATAVPPVAPIDTNGRPSAVWGQPRLSAYWRWRRAAFRSRHAPRLAALPRRVRDESR